MKKKEALIEKAERKAEKQQMQTVSEIVGMLRSGNDFNGDPLYTNGAKNPYENMPRREINDIVERFVLFLVISIIRLQPR